MKKNILYIASLSALTLTMSVVSCGKFGDINVDPNQVSQADTRYLFARAMQAVTIPVFNSTIPPKTGTYNITPQLYPQYLGEGKNIQFTEFTVLEKQFSGIYHIFLKNLQLIEKMNTDEATRSSAEVIKMCPSNANQIAVVRTLRGYYLMFLTDTYGGIPFHDILEGDNDKWHPKYALEKEIYETLDKELVEAFSKFDESMPLNGSADILYHGDISKWKRLNATIRMCMAIKLHDVDEAAGKARFAKAFADGAIMSNADNLTYKYLNETDNANPIYVNTVIDGREDYWPTQTLLGKFIEMKDPRALTYADPNYSNQKNPLQGVPWGITRKELTSFRTEHPLSHLYSGIAQKMDYRLTILSAAKVNFMCAEAAVRGWISGDPKGFYEDGIKLSFEEKGVNEVVTKLQNEGEHWKLLQEIYNFVLIPEEYLKLPAVDFAQAKTKEERIQRIALQRWLNGFMQDGTEAWSDWRRLNYPKLDVGDAGRPQLSHIPYRLMPDPTEYKSNRENYEEYLKNYGGNVTASTRIWWDVADNN